jgi:hypothetical protein
MRSWRPLTRAEWQIAAGLAILIWCACSPVRPAPLDFSGEWSGTTAQGRPIAFSISPDLRITALSIDFAFATCSGTVTMTPNAPLANPNGTASALAISTPNGLNGPGRTTVNFLFPSPSSANGMAQFFDYPDCGNGSATWTASKR